MFENANPTRWALLAGVSGLAVASGLNNATYGLEFGAVGVLVAISSDAFKFAAPIAFTAHVKARHFFRALATATVWAAATSFSLMIAVSASAAQKQEQEQQEGIAAQPARLPIPENHGCSSGDTACVQRASLLEAHYRDAATGPVEPQPVSTFSGDTIEARAISELLALADVTIVPATIALLMVYSWVTMLEVGSALGGLTLTKSQTSEK